MFSAETLVSSTKLSLVWRVAYNPDENEISPKRPLYFLKEAVEIKAGEVIRLL